MNLKPAGFMLVAFIALLQAQTDATTSRLEFETASVRQNKSGSLAAFNRPLAGGRLNITNAPVETLIEEAYGLTSIQVSGGPSWLATDRYDIMAKVEGSPTPAEMKLMLQSLLVDRFGLKFHHETKEMSIYALVESKSGIKNAEGLVKSREGDCGIFATDGTPQLVKPGQPRSDTPCGHVNFLMSARAGATLHAQGASISQLAHVLSTAVDPASCAAHTSGCHPVVDKTEIEGTFDIEMRWTPDLPPGSEPNADSAGPSIFTAIQEQLGLKLELQKGPADIFVIDQVERPSEN